ncbi:MAG: hypothetical protein KJO11_08000 [Gemmatimonadetes bacterium]|nr:hypothetical protein [Gemmatimonadota bacterium]
MHPARPKLLRPVFLLSLTVALVLVTGAFITSGSAPDAAASTAQADQAEWLAALDAPNRMLFDAAAPGNGATLIHVLNYYESWKQAADLEDTDIDAVVTFYGGTTFHGLGDAMWSKYGLGEVMDQRDAAGAPYTVNPWRVAPLFAGMEMAPAGIETLGGRGATFLLCNNPLTFLAGQVAAARGLDAESVYADMRANILPEVTLVPAMVVAIDRAQQAGISYHRQ